MIYHVNRQTAKRFQTWIDFLIKHNKLESSKLLDFIVHYSGIQNIMIFSRDDFEFEGEIFASEFSFLLQPRMISIESHEDGDWRMSCERYMMNGGLISFCSRNPHNANFSTHT